MVASAFVAVLFLWQVDCMPADIKELAENPLIQSLAESDPELAKHLSDPKSLMEWLKTPEGEASLTQITQHEEMQKVLNDPAKIKSLLADFVSDPGFEDLKESMPDLVKDVHEALEKYEL